MPQLVRLLQIVTLHVGLHSATPVAVVAVLYLLPPDPALLFHEAATVADAMRRQPGCIVILSRARFQSIA